MGSGFQLPVSSFQLGMGIRARVSGQGAGRGGTGGQDLGGGHSRAIRGTSDFGGGGRGGRIELAWEGLGRSLRRGQPYGDPAWTARMAGVPGLERTLQAIRRPQRKDELTPFSPAWCGTPGMTTRG
jgi:hypothetical protein